MAKVFTPLFNAYGSLHLADFFQAVGVRIFGNEWRLTDLKADDIPPTLLELGEINDASTRKLVVQLSILEALVRAEIIAEVKFGALDWRLIHYNALPYSDENEVLKRVFLQPPPLLESKAKVKEEAFRLLALQAELQSKSPAQSLLISKTSIAADDDDFDDEESSTPIELTDKVVDQLHSAILAFERNVLMEIVVTVKVEFWEELLATASTAPSITGPIDWARSMAKIPINFLDFKRFAMPGDEHKLVSRRFTTPLRLPFDINAIKYEAGLQLKKIHNSHAIYIPDAREAIEVASKKPSFIDANPWGLQYVGAIRRDWPLIIAAAWRIVAIETNSDVPEQHPQTGFTDLLHEYLQNAMPDRTAPSRSSLENVMREVLIQWQDKALNSDILINLGQVLPVKK